MLQSSPVLHELSRLYKRYLLTEDLLRSLVPLKPMMRLKIRTVGWTKSMKISSQPSKTISTSHNDQPNSGPYTADQYVRRADHTANTANTANEDEESYILTLRTNPMFQERINAIRTQHYPPHLNKVPAHIALYRALPGSQLDTITADISALAEQQRPCYIATGEFYLLKHGVAMSAKVPDARRIYDRLKKKWKHFLSKQDKDFKAHYTIQNKAEEGVPQRTLEELKASFTRSRGTVYGLSLFRYDQGYWRYVKDFMFPDS